MTVSQACSVLDEVRALMAAAKGDFAVRDVSPTDGHVVWLYARAWSTVGALGLLLRDGYLDAAMSLARGLFTDTVRLLELEQRQGDRPALVLGWANQALDDLAGVVTEAEHVGVETNPDRWTSWIVERRAAIRRAMIKRGIPRLLKLPPDKQLAAQHGLSEEYVDYRFGHLFVHGSPAIMGLRSVKTSDGLLGFAEKQQGAMDMIVGTALLASQLGLLSLKAFGATFELPLSERATELLAQIDHEARRRNEQVRASA
jgi:hypothetical protein